MAWVLITCFGRLIILEILEALTQNEELMKIKDHKDKSHVIIWAENMVELWSSKEEKISTNIKSLIINVGQFFSCFVEFIKVYSVSSYNR